MVTPLISCPDCGHTVSRKAGACPNCGRLIRHYQITAGVRKITKVVFLATGALSLVATAFLLFAAHRLSVPGPQETFRAGLEHDELQQLAAAQEKYRSENGRTEWIALMGRWVDSDPLLSADINNYQTQANNDGGAKDWLKRRRLDARSKCYFISIGLLAFALLVLILVIVWPRPKNSQSAI